MATIEPFGLRPINSGGVPPTDRKATAYRVPATFENEDVSARVTVANVEPHKVVRFAVEARSAVRPPFASTE